MRNSMVKMHWELDLGVICSGKYGGIAHYSTPSMDP
jgi:hypothetical protein